eukprot:58066-Chlamydomonas_euryale.AAC.2
MGICAAVVAAAHVDAHVLAVACMSTPHRCLMPMQWWRPHALTVPTCRVAQCAGRASLTCMLC